MVAGVFHTIEDAGIYGTGVSVVAFAVFTAAKTAVSGLV